MVPTALYQTAECWKCFEKFNKVMLKKYHPRKSLRSVELVWNKKCPKVYLTKTDQDNCTKFCAIKGRRGREIEDKICHKLFQTNNIMILGNYLVHFWSYKSFRFDSILSFLWEWLKITLQKFALFNYLHAGGFCWLLSYFSVKSTFNTIWEPESVLSQRTNRSFIFFKGLKKSYLEVN